MTLAGVERFFRGHVAVGQTHAAALKVLLAEYDRRGKEIKELRAALIKADVLNHATDDELLTECRRRAILTTYWGVKCGRVTRHCATEQDARDLAARIGRAGVPAVVGYWPNNEWVEV